MKEINREHPEYKARQAMLKQYRDLYVGGEQMKERASEYLTRRKKEPVEVYAERLSKVFYENYIGSIIDWYSATLFRREPVLTFEGASEAGKRYFSGLAEDCDLKGTSLSNFFRRQMMEMLVCGRAYMLVDFPRRRKAARNRAEEEALGLSRAYLVDYTPEEVINWSYDEHGRYEWVVLRSEYLRNPAGEGGDWTPETRWVYYDRENYRVYRGEGEEGAIRVVDEGQHGLARLRRTPLFEMRVSEGLWLMNKAALVQLEHFNKSNALSWALTMGLFAMPVVYSDKEWKQIIGESYYIQLGPNDRFGWTEPAGQVFQIAAENLARLQEEIYRVCYLLNQGRGGQASQIAQSALSKQRDFAITQEVLRGYGDIIKDGMKRVLRSIEAAREDGLEINVSGLDDFDIGDFGTDLGEAERLLSLGIESPTLKRAVFKKLAAKYLCDARQDVKDRIADEIDGSVR